MKSCKNVELKEINITLFGQKTGKYMHFCGAISCYFVEITFAFLQIAKPAVGTSYVLDQELVLYFKGQIGGTISYGGNLRMM